MAAPGSLYLLTAARNLVATGRARDTLHVVLTALMYPQYAGPAGEVIAHLDTGKRDRLYGALKAGVDICGESAAFGDADPTTERYRRCEEFWRQQAPYIPAGLTSALVLMTIVQRDGVTGNLLTIAGIDPRELALMFETKLGIPEVGWGAPPNTPWGGAGAQQNAGGWAPGGPGGPPWAASGLLDQRAAQRAAELCHPITPSRLRLYRERHPAATTYFLNALGASAREQDVAVLVGRKGSPIEMMGYIVADRLSAGEPFVGQQELLNNYRAVYHLSAPDLVALAGKSWEVPPLQVLSAAKQLVASQNAMLMVDHIEALRGAGPAEAALRGELAVHGTALLFGVYYLLDDQQAVQDAEIGLSNARVVRVNPSGADETRDFVRRFYLDYWASLGYTFAQDAFDGIFALEPGCWLDLKRTTLPYLIVQLAEDAIQTAMRGTTAIVEVARGAAEALKSMYQQEWPNVSEEVKRPFDKALQQVQTDINALAQRPAPAEQHQHGQVRRMLTRGHVEAQLFYPNESEFHLPGFSPNGPTGPAR